MKTIFTTFFVGLTFFVATNTSMGQTVTDIDGNIYHTVTIGNQVWMVENLKTTHYRNGDPIPKLGSGKSDSYCTYGDVNTYGNLYTWYVTKDSRNVAPAGWRIPNDKDWSTLTSFLGGYKNAGGALKEAGLSHWNSPNTGATNSSGFTALPGGYFVFGSFAYLGHYGVYWSTDVGNSPNQGSCRYLTSDQTNITWTDGEPGQFFSIRCIKDTSYVFIPQIYTSNSSLIVGQTQTITGSNFTNNGTINLYVQNSNGDLIPANNSFTYLANGGFSYQLPITSDMPGGEYSVYATDVITGISTSTIKFLVNNSAQTKLWINAPQLNAQYVTNQPISIQWGDNITKSVVIGKTAFVQKNYKIQLSNDNGSTWSVIEAEHKEQVPTGTNYNDFLTTTTIATPGTSYKIKITDNSNHADYNISKTFKVVSASSGGFNYSYEWDQSSPLPDGMPHPTGLTADGTSRFFIKLLRISGNNKAVSKIRAVITSNGDGYSTTDLLGKIMYATNHTTYNEDGNNATLSSYTYAATNPNDNEYWFWLVAPDDFTHNLSDQRSERQLKVTFYTTYTDNSKDTTVTKQLITVVRPPLFLVHGIDGSSESFKNFQYNIYGQHKFFNTDGANGTIISNPLWKESQRLNLINYESYARNAEIILGINVPADKYYNSFQVFLNAMHKKGYACNRVDYVAHSMGGCVARTIINLYSEAYKPPLDKADLYAYKNYSKGFINKLITLNTPHNGSDVADLLDDRFKTGLDNSLIYALRAGGRFQGYFISNGSELGIPLYQLSPATKDLQAYDGGITFSKTIVKNHLIGTDVDLNNDQSELQLRFQSGNASYNALYSLLLPSENIHDFMLSHYSNNEYLSNSDFIVPVSSQLPGKTSSDLTDISFNPIGETNASILYGVDKNHTEVRSDIIVGTRVMYLLNAPINSSYFADDIAANPNPNGSHTYKTSGSFADSIKTYYDKAQIKIQSPLNNATKYVDSSFGVTIKVKDTSHLQQIQVFFQGQLYQSNSKDLLQTFNVQVSSNAIGKDKILAEGIYDSSGFTIIHIDTVNIHVNSLDTLKGFYISPKSVNLNPQQTFIPEYNAIFSHYVGIINNDNSSLQFKIGDTHVIKYVDSLHEFIAKDTGTTYIICKYKGFADTGFIYITNSQGGNTTKTLPANNFAENKSITTDDEHLKVYPNPTKGKFTIELDKANIISLNVTDANGKVVYRNSSLIKTTTLQIDLSKYASGVYYIEATDGKKKYNKKVVIEK